METDLTIIHCHGSRIWFSMKENEAHGVVFDQQ